MAGGFKQACPSCEAKVSVLEDEIGKKKECPECKFRFKVEAPSKDKPAEKKPADKKPSKEAAVKAKAEIKKAATEDKTSKKPSGKKKNNTLLIGGAVGGVALIAIIGAIAMFFMGGEEPAPEKKKGKRDRGQQVAKSNNQKAPETNPDMPPEEKKAEPETPPMQTAATPKKDNADPDISNWLPNDTKMIQLIHMKGFMDTIPMRAMINTPGAFNRDDFKKTFGVALEEMDQVMLARSAAFDLSQFVQSIPFVGMMAPKGWKMAILRSEKPFDLKILEASMGLTTERPVENIKWHKVSVPLDALSTTLFDFDPQKDKLSMTLVDARTMVLGTEAKMQDFLAKDKAKPKKISTPPPPPMPMADPNNPMPPGAEGAAPPAGGVKPAGEGAAPPPGGARPAGEGASAPPADPNAPPMPMPAAPPAAVTGNQYQTLPGRFSKAMLKIDSEVNAKFKPIITVGMDIDEINKLIPSVATAMGSMKTPGGAPVSQELISQVKATPKLEYGFLAMGKFDQSEQAVGVGIFSRDRKLGSEFIKLIFPLVKKMPFMFKELKMDVAEATEDLTGLSPDGTPAEGGPGGAPPPMPVPVGGEGNPAGGAAKQGTHGFVNATAKYFSDIESMGVFIMADLKLPPAIANEFEKGMGASMMETRNKMEVGVVKANPHSFAKGLNSYVKEKKAFPRGTAIEATNASKFGLKMPPEKRVGWLAELLPLLSNGEYQAFTRKLDKTKAWNDPVNLPIARIYIAEFMHSAPVDGLPLVPSLENPGVTNFVGVSGVGRAAADYDSANKKRGVFGYDRITKVDEIKDGLDKTIAVILTPQNRHQPWLAGGGATIVGIPESPDALEQFLILEDPKTKEKYGIAIMADGKVRKLTSKITPEIFKALCTVDGGETVDSLDSIAPVIKEQLPAS